MTVPAQTDTFNSSVANGATTIFPYNFLILDAADLEVTIDGVVQVAGFTVSGVGADVGGNVTFGVAPANGKIIGRELRPLFKRDADYQQFGDWEAETVNDDFDKLWIAARSLNGRQERSLHVSSADVFAGVDPALPPPSGGSAIGWAADGKSLINIILQTGTTLVSLAAAGGSALIGWVNSFVGAVTRTVQDKLRDHMNAADAGCPLDGTSDDVPGLQLCFTALGAAGGVIHVANGKTVLIDSNITIPDNVEIRGSRRMKSSFGPVDSAVFSNRMLVNSAATITLQNSSGITNFLMLRKGLSWNITSAQVASQFLGSAITLADAKTDAFVENCAILGFLYGIRSIAGATNIARSRLKHLLMDNINCIYLQNSLDTHRLHDIHCWPFVTVSSTPEAQGAHLKRSGAGVRLDDSQDWTALTEVFTFGYFRGIQLSDTTAVQMNSCGSDYPASTSDGAIGLLIEGASGEITSIAHQIAASAVGVYVNSTGSNNRVNLIAPSIWETIDNAIVNERGTVLITAPRLRKTGGTGAGVATISTSTNTKIMGGSINGFSVGISNGSSSTKMSHDGVDFTGTTTAVVNPYNPSVASAAAITLNGENQVYHITGTSTINDIVPVAAYAGKSITLIFDAALTVGDSVGNIKLNGNFVTTADDTLTLVSDGTNWFEQSRTAN